MPVVDDIAGLRRVLAQAKTIAVVGLHDVIVVRTVDATLVTTREHAQRVKDVVSALKDRGRDDLV